MEYPELKKELNKRNLLEEEKKMWLRIGLYVSTEREWVGDYAYWGYKVLDSMANTFFVKETVGSNIRQSILAWWQVERIRPRASEPIDVTGFNELEVERNA